MSKRDSNVGIFDLVIISAAFVLVGILLFLQDAELDERLTRIETIMELADEPD